MVNESDNIYHLEAEKIDETTILQIGCDCLIAIQDLNEYKDIGHEKFIIFFEQYVPILTYGNYVVPQQTEVPPQEPHYSAQPIDPYVQYHQQQHQPYPYQTPTSVSQTDMNRPWSCPHCTFLNPYTNLTCEQCYKSPTFRPDMPTEVPTAVPSTAIKYCDKCHQPNRMQDVNCTHCRSLIIHSRP